MKLLIVFRRIMYVEIQKSNAIIKRNVTLAQGLKVRNWRDSHG